MAYDLHVTRAPSGSDAADHPITEAEVAALAQVDPELDLRPPSERRVTNPATGAVIVSRPPWSTLVWTGHPDGGEVPLRVWAGRLTVARPDDAVIAKLRAIATHLGARVVGDEGETY